MSPGSGTTATGFSFAVTYRDSGDCAPTRIVVHVNGLGDYLLSGPGSGFKNGVVFSRTLTVGAPGSYAYSFQASSGTGPGAKSVALTGVSPAGFSVSAPPPTPGPTAPPTPRPTPVPPPPATPVPTPTASSTMTPAATATEAPTLTPSETTGATPSPSAGSASSSGSGGGIIPGGASPRPRSNQGAGFSPPQAAVRFAEWAAITVGALGLFLFLARRRPRLEEPAATAGIVFPSFDPAQPASARSVQEPRVLADEANMPRWLRPSVQAAREGRYIRD